MPAAETAGRDIIRPAIDQATLVDHMRNRWGITYTHGVEMPSERDRNFHLYGLDQESVVKVCHQTTTREDVESRLDAMEALADLAGFVVPAPQRAVNGSRVSFIDLVAGRHVVYAMSFVPGRAFADLHPVTARHLDALGAAARVIPDRMAAIESVPNDFLWDLRRAPETVRRLSPAIASGAVRTLVATTTEDCAAQLGAAAGDLTVTTIHGDLNDANVVVDGDGTLGILDFGDIHRSYRVAELAIAAAYATIRMPDPIAGVVTMVRAASAHAPLTEAEADAFVALLRLRLALSLAIGSTQTAADPDNPYLAVSREDAAGSLERWSRIPPRLANAHVRHAAGLAAVPHAGAIVSWLGQHAESLSSPLEVQLTPDSVSPFDWSVTSPHVAHPDSGDTVADATVAGEELLRRAGAIVGLGCWGEPRLVYATPEYDLPTNGPPRTRTVHTGVDLSCRPGTAVLALYGGVVERIDDDAVEGGYGPVVTLRHEADDLVFWSLYGHLARHDRPVEIGDAVATGQRIGSVGEAQENGGWPPHLHFQLMTDTLDLDRPFPGVAAPDEWEVWAQICPSPAAALRLDPTIVAARQPDDESVVRARRRLLPPSLSTSYERPLVAVRGVGVHLYDGWGRRHLDCVNNVAHVGHGHPHVVEAIAAQARLLATNSRYPHPERVRYMERLAALFPDPLDTVFLVNSGSEANDLALRIAQTVTGRTNIVVAEHGYHGHTKALLDISHYKHAGRGGHGTPSHVTLLPLPDPLRSPDRDHLATSLELLEEAEPAAGLFEAIPSVAGQVVLPEGYLSGVTQTVRAAGGLIILDEVQTGLGRVGPDLWAYVGQGVVPDIVTLGKPIGNGHPLGALVTTRAVAEAFANGMEYFNTFGGNPVSCAAGNAVLDVVDHEQLPVRARDVGDCLHEELETLAAAHPLIGDVRGRGLFLGVELVADKDSLEPASDQARYITERGRELGVLLAVDGPERNVLKIKPPLVFGAAHVEVLVETLARMLGEDGAQPG